MVIHKENKKWECPYCAEKYTDEQDAKDCAEECAKMNVDAPIERDGQDEFICEYCEGNFRDYFDAGRCENRHIKAKDKYYENKCYADSMKKLKEAGEHPCQEKLAAY